MVTIVSNASEPVFSLEDYMRNPPDGMEWVDGQLVEKNSMTFKHGRVQAKLAFYWRSHLLSSGQGGEVCTETSCRTVGRGRCPDVSYLTPELIAQYGEFNVLPQSFSLIAEIISPTDAAEDVFGKANEYLQSGCQEVWLILPESQWIVVITTEQRCLFTKGEVVNTHNVLQGCGGR